MTLPSTNNAPAIEPLAEVRKALNAIAHDRASPITSTSTDDFRTWRKQTIADLIGLPRACARRSCRRKRRCAAPGVPCIDAHRDLITHRLAVLLGYSAGELFSEADDDLTW